MRVELALLATLAMASMGHADNFSFTGSFTQDDNVQLFNFVVGAPSTVTLLTTSYAGGTNAAGQVIAEGGFDPILALFNSTGVLIGQNDDGGAAVPADAETGREFDTFLQEPLVPGTYTVSVMQYDNFAKGPNLSDGFSRSGQGNYTGAAFGCGAGVAFCDVTADVNDSHWAFDILNVGGANQVPEPRGIALLGTALLGCGILFRRFRA